MNGNRWRDIRTAPRDGTWFQARTAGGDVRRVHFHDRDARMPINETDGMWSTPPIQWRPALNPEPSHDPA